MTFIKHPKDFWAGVLYITFGATAVAIALNYPAGTAGRMGPGYFPRALGAILVALGLLLSLRALRLEGARIAFASPKPLLVVIGSVVVFGIAAPPLGSWSRPSSSSWYRAPPATSSGGRKRSSPRSSLPHSPSRHSPTGCSCSFPSGPGSRGSPRWNSSTIS